MEGKGERGGPEKGDRQKERRKVWVRVIAKVDKQRCRVKSQHIDFISKQ